MKIFTRRDLFDLMDSPQLPSLHEKLEFLEHYLINKDNYSEEQKEYIKQEFAKMKSEFQRRRRKAKNTKHYFIQTKSKN